MTEIKVKFADVSIREDFYFAGYEYIKSGKSKAFNENAGESFTFSPKAEVLVWRY